MKKLLISTAIVAFGANAANAELAFSHGDITIDYSDHKANFALFDRSLTQVTGRLAYDFGAFGLQVDLGASKTENVFFGGHDFSRLTFHGGYQISDPLRVGAFASYGTNTGRSGLTLTSRSLGGEIEYDLNPFSIQASYTHVTNYDAVGAVRGKLGVYRVAAMYAINDQVDVFARVKHTDVLGLPFNQTAYEIGGNYSFANAPFKMGAYYGVEYQGALETGRHFGVNLTYEFGPNSGDSLWDFFGL